MPLQTYHSTGSIKQSQVGRDEMNLKRGILVNVKNNEMDDISYKFFDVSKIMKVLLDEDEIGTSKAPAVYVNKFSNRFI